VRGVDGGGEDARLARVEHQAAPAAAAGGLGRVPLDDHARGQQSVDPLGDRHPREPGDLQDVATSGRTALPDQVEDVSGSGRHAMSCLSEDAS
jgi:hypothetical protein